MYGADDFFLPGHGVSHLDRETKTRRGDLPQLCWDAVFALGVLLCSRCGASASEVLSGVEICLRSLVHFGGKTRVQDLPGYDRCCSGRLTYLALAAAYQGPRSYT